MKLLEVENLHVSFRQKHGLVQAVRGVSMSIDSEGQSIGIVGESGSGKSVTSLALMRLIDEPPGKVAADQLRLRDVDLLPLRESRMQALRGGEIAMIFQEPMTSFDPVFTIGQQLIETIIRHTHTGKRQSRAIAEDLLRKVEIPEPKVTMKSYPHELSGGMRQRAMIAMALSCQPKILIADEPTTALDVTVQAQVLQLIKDLQSDFGMALLIITHDMGVIAETTDRLDVMYGGKIMEKGTTIDVFETPVHPYTQALLRSIPKVSQTRAEPLYVIEGSAPSPLDPPDGCPFHPRCPMAKDVCAKEVPPTTQVSQDHEASCWRLES